MAGYMYLGNKKVCPAILIGGDTYNLKTSDFVGEIDSNGTLVPATRQMSPVFNGVEDISSNQLKGMFSNNTRVVAVSFPNLKTVSGESALESAFYRDSNLAFCYFPELESITGNNGMAITLCMCPSITEVSFPKLKNISGDSAFRQFLYGSAGVERVSFPSLETAGMYTFDLCMSQCSNIKTIDLHSLKTAGDRCFHDFCSSSSVISVDFSSLENCGDYCFLGAFYNANSIQTVEFPKLSVLGSYALKGAFDSSTSIKSLWFNALTPESFGGETTQFNQMLYGCNGVTVHFPAELEDTLENWPDVIAGFSGTNTEILYDIDPCYVVINVVGTSDYDIYVKGKEKTSPFTTGSSNKEYCVYDNTNARVFFGMLTGLVTGETSTFTADVTVATNRVDISTGSASYPVHISYRGQDVPLVNDGNGDYHFFYNGSGNTFSCVVEETENTRYLESSFTTDGTNMSISLVPQQKEWSTFDRPNLTSDGVIGGDAFAVGSSGTYNTGTSYQAWRAVDGDTSNSYYWYSKNETNPQYYFYNNNGIKIQSLTFNWTSTNYRATQVVIEGSNDNSSWTTLGTYSLASATSVTATVNSSTAYKYYKLTFTKGGTYIRMKELVISATVWI